MREKLMDIVCESIATDRCVAYCSRPHCGLVHTVVQKLIANGVTIQKWIPVSERLPEEWKDVLVLLRFGCCETAVYLGVPGKWRVTWNHDMIEVDSVTHWMPLPEPPSGERRTDA